MKVWSSRYPKWRRRVLLYRFFGALPFGERLFDQFRRLGGALRQMKLDCRMYVLDEFPQMIREAGKTVHGKVIAEIGSGWHPLLPVVFYGLGAKEIRMTDIVAHMRPDYVSATIEYVLARCGEIAEKAGAEESAFKRRVESLHPRGGSWKKHWAEAGISYHAPMDFRSTTWQDESIDMIFSNSCLGYIPRDILKDVFKEVERVLRPGGWTAHDISVYDDFSGMDRTISPFNFLYYNADEWERIGNCRLHFQNRLRPSEYMSLMSEAKLQVRISNPIPHGNGNHTLNREQLAPEFRQFSEEDLICGHFLVLSEKR